MIEPYRGMIYDPACGSGGMFVQSVKFIEAHHGNKKEIAKKDFSLVPSKYIEFVNRDESIDFDEKMKMLQKDFAELLKMEKESKKDLLKVFKELGYGIE
jgi:type I restriction-modification system DNA methylase subunit